VWLIYHVPKIASGHYLVNSPISDPPPPKKIWMKQVNICKEICFEVELLTRTEHKAIERKVNWFKELRKIITEEEWKTLEKIRRQMKGIVPKEEGLRKFNENLPRL
jgi:hypothetical protein